MALGRRRKSILYAILVLIAASVYGAQGAVAAEPLVAELVDPYPASECQTMMFVASAYGGEGALSYRWSFDGASWTAWSDLPFAEHLWDDDYAGTVSLEVTDGVQVASDSAAVLVQNSDPFIQALAGPAAAVAVGAQATVAVEVYDGEFRDFTASADTLTLGVSWGDGASADIAIPAGQLQASASHAYGAAGTYTVLVTCADDDGGSCSGSLTIVVEGTADSLARLLDEVVSPDIPSSVSARLSTRLQAALQNRAANQPGAAINQLNAFKNQVEAQRGKSIPAPLADAFLAMAQQAIVDLG